MKIIILAGGSGTRLWPLSRERYPKQFIKLMGSETSLFQETFKRSLMITAIDEIYVVTNEKYKFLVMGEVDELGYEYSEDNILTEPEAKNTLPAIYYGVHKIRQSGEDNILVLPSDHLISKGAEFVSLVRESDNLSHESIITFGIKPDSPNTGYGYIAPGEEYFNGFRIKEFKEKPDLKAAQKYVKEGYLWNGGIFIFNSSVFTKEIIRYAPEVYNAFEKNKDIIQVFASIKDPISIDYGVMEKTDKAAVVIADIGWSDLGSFDSFYCTFPGDENNNICNSDNIIIDSSNNVIHTETSKAVAAIGVEDLIIIDKKDALLICRKDRSQDVKEVVNLLRKKNDIRTEYHLKDYRPWGNYKILEEEKNCFKIKRIVVNPGKKLSYQLHHHRSEHWVIVKGMAKITIDGNTEMINEGESIYIKAGEKHRLENPGKIPLEIIEVQMGNYLEEDDIVRFDDEYGRK